MAPNSLELNGIGMGGRTITLNFGNGPCEG